jgi:dihydropteroate synthase
VPYIAMHMRGDPATMQRPENTQYELSGSGHLTESGPEPGPSSSPIWQIVGEELQARLDAAVAAGIPAWNIIPDPGASWGSGSGILRTCIRSWAQALNAAMYQWPMISGLRRMHVLSYVRGLTRSAMPKCSDSGATQ